MRQTNKFEFYFQNQVLAVQRRLRDKQKIIVCRSGAAAAAAHNAVEVCVALFFLFCVNEYMVDHIIIIIIASYVLACVLVEPRLCGTTTTTHMMGSSRPRDMSLFIYAPSVDTHHRRDYPFFVISAWDVRI